MKKLILTLIACGIITGSGLFFAQQASGGRSITGTIVGTSATEGALIGAQAGAITGVGAIATAAAGATGGAIGGLWTAHTYKKEQLEYIESGAAEELNNNPELYSLATNEKLLAAEEQFVQQRAFEDIAAVMESPEATGWCFSRECRKDRARWDRFTMTDRALYYLGCSNTEKGCCTEKDKDGNCVRWDKKSYDERIKRMEEECGKNPDGDLCDQELLTEMKHINSMSPQEKNDTLFGRAFDLQPYAAKYKGNGQVATELKTQQLKEDKDITAIQSSAARYYHGALTDFFKDPENIQQALSGSSTSSGNTASTPGNTTSQEGSGTAGSNETAGSSGTSDQGNTGNSIPNLTDADITTLSTVHTNALIQAQLQTNAAILEEIRRRINEEADARRRERLTKVVNELDALQKSLSGSMDCTGADCYKVYDVGDKNGKSVTGGQTLSNYIDIR